MIDQTFTFSVGFIFGMSFLILLIAVMGRRGNKPPVPEPASEWKLSDCGKFVYRTEKLGDSEVVRLREAWNSLRAKSPLQELGNRSVR